MEILPIAYVESIFKEKFGIPRQSGLCPNATGFITFENNTFNRQALQDLEGYSHLWIIFIFHQQVKSVNTPKIRPPRLGGNKAVGVFSSRSPNRPNPLGLSLVEMGKIFQDKNFIKIEIANHDLLDGTLVVDIKPYISHDQPQNQVTFGWQNESWEKLNISFSSEAEQFLTHLPDLRQIVTDILQNDPRPAYKSRNHEPQTYTMNINNYEISFMVRENLCTVLKISY